ncbi:hypothetical protein AOLI_G00234100 [Acnodon oligacanthus]
MRGRQHTSAYRATVTKALAAPASLQTTITKAERTKVILSVQMLQQDDENVPHGNQYDISMVPVYQSLKSCPDISDSDYDNMAGNTDQSDFIYENVNIDGSG